MSNCTLSFYKLPVNLLGKNFVLESLPTYLSTLTPLTINDFQYQRPELTKKIKVSMSQDYSGDYTNISKYNFLKIVQPRSDTGYTSTTTTYYYLIKSAKQISQKTIEFELVMDTLNTFSFSNVASNNTYTLSDKSLITREHKDRMGTSVSVKGTPLKYLPELEVVYYIPMQFFYELAEFTHVFSANSRYAFDIVTKNQIHSIDWNYATWVPGRIQIQNKNATSFRLNYMQLDQAEDWEGSSYASSQTILNSDVDNLVMIIKFFRFDSTDQASLFLMSYMGYFFKFDGFEVPRIIDKFQEGIESITFKNSEVTLYDQDGENGWYVAYSSANSVVADPDDSQAKYVNPVICKFYSDLGYTLTTQSATIVRFTASEVPKYNNVEEFIFISASDLGATGYIEVNGVKHYASEISGYPPSREVSFCLEKVNNSDITFKRFGIIQRDSNDIFFARKWANVIVDTPFSYVDFYGVNDIGVWTGINLYSSNAFRNTTISIGSGDNTDTVTSPSIDEVDLTDEKLVKVINFPYCPVDELSGKTDFTYLPTNFVKTNDSFALYKYQKTKFDRRLSFSESPFTNLNVVITESEIGKSKSRNIKYESKLFHSDFYQPKFVYDSFAFVFRLEDIDVNTFNNLTDKELFFVRYVCSNNMKSKFMFQFNQYVCNREFQDYNNVLIVERNNEKAIYTNAYINYIRSGGYTYDTKNADMQKLTSGLNIALGVVGSVGSIVGGIVTENPIGIAGGVGMAVATATRTISAIHSAQQNDRQIAQKLLQATNQSTSVSTSEDLDVLKAYSNNKAKLCFYQSSDYLRNALWDLFHYFGYKCQDYKVPVVNTRIAFNFVQGDIQLKDYTFNEEIASDIIAKWKDGVTFMHHYNHLGKFYDWNQEYENFEIALMSE